MELLKINNLKKSFQDMTAVDGLSLTINSGEVHGILGPNGAGKSTTINCVLGLITYDSGTVVFEGSQNIKQWSRNIGYVPQDLAIYPDLTPTENIQFFCSLYGFTGNELRERTRNALDFVGLTEVKDKKAGEFSGGMKRRLNLACGIVHSPKLVIMDEPTVGIDPQSRNRILENVAALSKGGTTILYTTHYMPEVEEICSKVTIIDHGKLIASGTKTDIMNRMGKDTELTITFTEDHGDIDPFIRQIESLADVHQVSRKDNSCHIRHPEDKILIDQVIALSVQHGLTIEKITNQEPSLEEIFLSLTGKELRDGK